jgi:S-adenosylmethionine hydrolase
MVAPPIVLTTDFGPASAYVGMMKGVILGINPSAIIVDLTHQIQPQDVTQASFVLGTSYRFFPHGSIHVVVVDPGVGTQRRALLLVTPTARFLAPDNGVLSPIIQQFQQQSNQKSPPGESNRVPVPPGCAAYQLTNPQYWVHPVSRTFHGRDIFAPVAANLSLGTSPETLGQRITELVWLPTPEPTCEGNTIQGRVVTTDHFGNLITNISDQSLAGAGAVQVEIKGRRITGLSRTFHDEESKEAGPLLALVGSHGYLEIALRDGNAAGELMAGPGEPVYVRTMPLPVDKEA